MKRIVLGGIVLYQHIFSYIVKNIVGVNNCCRFEITCSQFAKAEIQNKGLIKGGASAVKRLAKCQPFYKGDLNGRFI